MSWLVFDKKNKVNKEVKKKPGQGSGYKKKRFKGKSRTLKKARWCYQLRKIYLNLETFFFFFFLFFSLFPIKKKMYSSNQQEFHMDNNTDHMFVNNQPRTRTSLNQTQSSSYLHHNTNNFGPMAINPSSTVGPNNVGFADPSTNWFSTSLDSNASSFGQSPVFGGRDLLVTPSNSTGHIIEGFAAGPDDDELSQRK